MLDSWMQVQDSVRIADLGTILIRIALSALAGLAVATSYLWSHGREKQSESRSMFATLVLLCMFIAMVSMVIGNSVAMAFSLVGALSIVRFRTVVEDTRDTAFVIFSVITGMAMGAGYFAVPLIGVPFAAAVAIALNRWSQNDPASDRMRNPMLLSIRMGIGRDMSSVLDSIFSGFVEQKQFISTSTMKQGSAIEVQYRVQLKANADPVALVSFANLVEGIQAVELKPQPKES
ncbi:MAG: DUF4956 domain-containing protein [Pirellula sp.]